MAIIDSPALLRSGHSDDPALEADSVSSAPETAPAPVETPAPDQARTASPVLAPPAAPGRQSSFLAELARAMHAAADAQRSVVLERARLDAEAFVEQVQARSTEEAAALKRTADSDIAGIRDWSKAEIARIREETEARIGDRKAALEGELAAHAERVGTELGRVEHQASAFEAEMRDFFEHLLEEQDPARFAALAANLPEPPSFDSLAAAEDEPLDEDGAPEPVAQPAAVEPVEETLQEPAEEPQSTVEAAAVDSPAPAVEVESAEQIEHSLAEAEAAAAADAVDGDVEETTDASPEQAPGAAWAARLAGLVGRGQSEPTTPAESPTESATASELTQVVVVGLVSVASIAGFKRQLGHLSGVASVAVSSGPDGEFVFRVTHGNGLVLRDAIPTLPGFQARVVSFAPGIVHVSARDPESEA